ncbi:MAG: hypothetical protein ABSB59_39620 [Streptosporangiaceae bacterium]|jgi:hypothetical protein
MLAVVRSLMSRPSLLLCDEPSPGLAPLVVRSVFASDGLTWGKGNQSMPSMFPNTANNREPTAIGAIAGARPAGRHLL